MLILMLNCSSIDEIYLNEKPSFDLFAALMMIAISSFPEDCLNPNIEVSFAALSIAHTFLTKWPNISPCLFTYTNFIPLFTELWQVYLKEERDVFSKFLFAFQQYDKSVAFIINKVSTLSGNVYSYLIDIAKKMSFSSPQTIPTYKLSEKIELMIFIYNFLFEFHIIKKSL